MERTDLIELIKDGVPQEHARAQVWADMGAGVGNFTRSLATLLAPSSTIYAVDRDQSSLRNLRRAIRPSPAYCRIEILYAGFLRPLDLPPLDGVLMANSLHFNKDQKSLIACLLRYLRPGGRLLLVEYDVSVPRPWIPHPLSFKRLTQLAAELNFAAPRLVGSRRSRWSANGVRYATTIVREM